jgi:hypothetical protein
MAFVECMLCRWMVDANYVKGDACSRDVLKPNWLGPTARGTVMPPSVGLNYSFVIVAWCCLFFSPLVHQHDTAMQFLRGASKESPDTPIWFILIDQNFTRTFRHPWSVDAPSNEWPRLPLSREGQGAGLGRA